MYYPIYFGDEIYTLLTEDHIQGIDRNRYWVSNYGSVYDSWNQRFLSISTVGCGYLEVTLHTNEGKKHVLIHRLVGIVYIPGDRSLQINHMDGIKTNCSYANLEWVTPLENLRHAINTGLQKIGEDKPNAILTNEQVHIICQDLVNRTPIATILNHIGLEDTKKNRDLIVDVKRGKTFKHISSQYDFDKLALRTRSLDNDTVLKICGIFQNNPNISYSDIIDLLNLPYNSQKERRILLNMIGSIKLRRAYTDLSKNFVW